MLCSVDANLIVQTAHRCLSLASQVESDVRHVARRQDLFIERAGGHRTLSDALAADHQLQGQRAVVGLAMFPVDEARVSSHADVPAGRDHPAGGARPYRVAHVGVGIAVAGGQDVDRLVKHDHRRLAVVLQVLQVVCRNGLDGHVRLAAATELTEADPDAGLRHHRLVAQPEAHPVDAPVNEQGVVRSDADGAMRRPAQGLRRLLPRHRRVPVSPPCLGLKRGHHEAKTHKKQFLHRRSVLF